MIPVNEPLLVGNEANYINECLQSGWISSEGPFVEKFETGLAKYVKRQHGIAVTNGTAALELAVAALGIQAGDEVIMPTFTIISCATAIIRAGAIPVLVDCRQDTWNMDVEQIEARITSRTRAIMVVHIYGLPVDIDKILELADKYNLLIIEDAAEVLGQTYKEQPCGSFGDISTFSFYPNKHVTTGEGGMVLTNDPALAERCRSLRNLCFQPHKRFVHEEMGWNFRMSNLQAALGLAQLENLEKSVKKKRDMGCYYNELLSNLGTIQLPLARTLYAENIYWIYGVVIKEDIDITAAQAMQALGRKGIGTRPFFWPMHKQPVFEKMGYFRNDSLPVAEMLAEKGFYIPSGLSLDKAQQTLVAEEMAGFLA